MFVVTALPQRSSMVVKSCIRYNCTEHEAAGTVHFSDTHFVLTKTV